MRLGGFRGFYPTADQDDVLERYLDKTCMPFTRMADEAFREYLESRGYKWPAKYGRKGR